MPQKKKNTQKKTPTGKKKGSRASSGRKKGSTKALKPRRKQISIALLLTGIIIGAIFAAYFFGLFDLYSDWRTNKAREADSEQIASIIDKLPPPPIETLKPEVIPPPPVLQPAYRVAIVIDDMGQGLKKINDLIKINSELTVSILPYLSHSAEVAELANSSGLEVLLHIPMEPHNMKEHDPGDGILHTSMSDEELSSALLKNIEEVPYITGMNNHMGSKFTEDRKGMKTVMEVAGNRGLYFLDSKTTNASVAVSIANSVGVKNASRNIFLDNKRDEEYIKGQLDRLIRIAKKRGYAVAIGHPYPETIAVLARVLPSIEERGVRVVHLSELVK